MREYNKSQDFELAFKMDTDMQMKKLLLEFERVYQRYSELFEIYYRCFDEDGTHAVSVPGWEMHNLGAHNISMHMSLYWMLLKLKMLEQAYFRNPTDQELRSQVLKSRREFKKSVNLRKIKHYERIYYQVLRPYSGYYRLLYSCDSMLWCAYCILCF